MKIVEVHWVDAYKCDEHFEEDDTFEPMNARTVGYLHEDEDTHVTLAHEWFPGESRRGRTIIPRGMVQFVVTLSEGDEPVEGDEPEAVLFDHTDFEAPYMEDGQWCGCERCVAAGQGNWTGQVVDET